MTAYYIRSATFIYWLLVGWYDLIMSTHLINVSELSYNIYALTYMSKHVRTNFQDRDSRKLVYSFYEGFNYVTLNQR